MANIVELVIKGNDQSARAISSAVKNLEGMGSAFGAIRSSLAGIVSTGAMASLAREALQMGDSISKASEKLGIGAEKLSAMMYAAAMSDVSLEGLEKGMKKFSQAIVEAQAAGSDAATAFSVMGIATKDAEGKTKSLDILFSEVANSFAQMEDGAGKVSLAVALFGRSGMDMIPILNKGAAGIRELEGDAKRLGATISGDTAKKLEEANDNLKSFWMSVKGVSASITGTLVGALMKMGDAFGTSLGAAAGEGFDTPGPNAVRFKAPPLPKKTEAPNLDLIKKNAEEAKKIREKYEKLELDGQVAFAEAMVQANDAEAKALSDIQKEYWTERDKEDETYRQMDLDGWAAYAEARVKQDEESTLALSEVMKKNTEDSELYKIAWMDATMAVSDAMMSLYSGMQGWISSSLQGLIEGTLRVSDVLKNLGKMMLSIITDYIAKWLVSRLFMLAMGKTFQAAEIAAAVVTGTAVAAAWAPAAALVEIATLGGASVAAAAGLASTVALSQALAVPAMAEGGIVTRPTLALIGESGPEAVIPLGKGGAGPSGGDVYLDGDLVGKWMERRSRNYGGTKLVFT